MLLQRLALILIASLLAAPAQAEPKIEAVPFTSGRLAFTYSLNKNADIWVIDFEQARVMPLVQSSGTDEAPAWSNDGQTLAFSSNRSGNFEIYTVRADGEKLKQLTKATGADGDPDYSPDGKKIVFRSERVKTGTANLFLMDLNGESQEQLTNSGDKNTVPRWAPNGKTILYTSDASWPGWDLMLLNLETRQSKKLTQSFNSYCRGAWSPDGTKFLFSYGGDEVDLWMRDPRANEPKQITKLPGRDYDAVWNESGHQAFFVHEQNPGKEDYQIYLLNVDSGESLQITSGPGSIRHLAWTPVRSQLIWPED